MNMEMFTASSSDPRSHPEDGGSLPGRPARGWTVKRLDTCGATEPLDSGTEQLGRAVGRYLVQEASTRHAVCEGRDAPVVRQDGQLVVRENQRRQVSASGSIEVNYGTIGYGTVIGIILTWLSWPGEDTCRHSRTERDCKRRRCGGVRRRCTGSRWSRTPLAGRRCPGRDDNTTSNGQA